MSQQDLAAAMRTRGYKWSQATVWSVEAGERPLRYTESLELSDICGFSPEAKVGPPDARRGVEMSMKALSELLEKL